MRWQRLDPNQPAPAMDSGDHHMGERPRLLDLFCCAGGASLGYHRAGFDVVGVDVSSQPEYPFEFVRGDALRILDELADDSARGGFAAVHASPPCQIHTHAGALNRATASRLFNPHQELVGPTRDRLDVLGLPYVIENVPGAPMRDDIVLCGSSFGLGVVRHRWFELGGWTAGDQAPPCDGCRGAIRAGRAISVFGNGGGRTDGCGGMRGRFDDMTIRESFQKALGIDHVTNVRRLAEAIPPAYTEWVGRQLIHHIA